MNTKQSYDRVADEYVRRVFDELQHKPLDRQLLDRFVAEVKNSGEVCDVGCGPGQVARYLADRGAIVQGIDLSAAMIEQARKLNPGIEFAIGDMRNLSMPDCTCAGMTAFYSIIHISREQLPATLSEWHRVLQLGGLLLIAFHLGENSIHLDEWWGYDVDIDFHFFRSGEIERKLAEMGFSVEETIEREPYPEIEHQSCRAYIFARRDAANSVAQVPETQLT